MLIAGAATTDWPTVTIEEVAFDVTVGHVGPMADEYLEVGVPFLRSLSVERFGIREEGMKYISPDFHKKLKKSALAPGDVVIVRTGKPGTCAVIPDWLGDANCSDLVIVRCGPRIRPHFLCYIVNSIAGSHIDAHTVGAVQQHFNVGSARTLSFLLPPIEEQDRILGLLRDRCIRRLKELDASGVYGGDFLARDLWDEYSYEVQFGPHEMPGFLDPATAWAGIIHKIAAGELQKCSDALRAIIVTQSGFRGQCGSGDPEAVRDEEILAEVSDALARRAGRYDLDILGVDRFEHLVEYLSQGGNSICWEIVREICYAEGGNEWAYDIGTLLEPQGDLSTLAEELAAAAIQDILSDVADESRAFFFLDEHSEPITKWLAQHDALPFLSRVQARIAAERQEAGLS